MVRPTRRTRRQVRNNNERTSALFAAAFAHIEPAEEANDEVGGGGVAHVGVVIQFPPKMDENWLRYKLLN